MHVEGSSLLSTALRGCAEAPSLRRTFCLWLVIVQLHFSAYLCFSLSSSLSSTSSCTTPDLRNDTENRNMHHQGYITCFIQTNGLLNILVHVFSSFAHYLSVWILLSKLFAIWPILTISCCFCVIWAKYLLKRVQQLYQKSKTTKCIYAETCLWTHIVKSDKKLSLIRKRM